MLKHFGKILIGGRSGEREQALAVFLLWAVAFGWFATKEAGGAEMAGTQAVLIAAFPLTIANLAIAHGMEWISSQTGWGRQE